MVQGKAEPAGEHQSDVSKKAMAAYEEHASLPDKKLAKKHAKYGGKLEPVWVASS